MYEHADQSYLKRPKFMVPEVFQRTMEVARRYSEQHQNRKIGLTFHGGEPTLVGLGNFVWMLETAHRIMGSSLGCVSLQTNAILLTSEWAETLREWGVVVGVSLDGPPEIHDKARVRHDGGGSYRDTIRGLRALQAAGVNAGVLCVVDPMASGRDIYRHFLSLDVKVMDFLLPDVTHDSMERCFPNVKGSRRVYRYLREIFDEWISADDPEFRIRIFWNFLRQFVGSTPENDAFGNLGMSYLVIESDGDIEALDALKVCAPGANALGANIMNGGFGSLAGAPAVLRQAISGDIPLASKCMACREKTTCGGGYLPHRYSEAAGFNNPSVWCDDIFALLSHIRRSMIL
jgi:uncharacterized protein